MRAIGNAGQYLFGGFYIPQNWTVGTEIYLTTTVATQERGNVGEQLSISSGPSWAETRVFPTPANRATVVKIPIVSSSGHYYSSTGVSTTQASPGDYYLVFNMRPIRTSGTGLITVRKQVLVSFE